ncbi:hypothetical protein J1N35_005385 [Gossypium stocksii]|uniref:Uncharacterized protein n=1 Tax=Gossypium stocksii TaxID=47602 RepID=A0A9D4AJ79_9ROSI|nr:hypothetical protein J1N35_005385 [Gossypium stocksii]
MLKPIYEDQRDPNRGRLKWRQVRVVEYYERDAKEGKDDEAEFDEIGPIPTHPATMEKATKRPEGDKENATTEPEKDKVNATIGLEGDEEKTKLVSIETNHDGEEANPTSAPLMDATTPVPPQSTLPMTQQYHETNKLIDDLTKSDDEEYEVSINMLKRKQCYKHAVQKSTRPN